MRGWEGDADIDRLRTSWVSVILKESSYYAGGQGQDWLTTFNSLQRYLGTVMTLRERKGNQEQSMMSTIQILFYRVLWLLNL